MLKVLDRHGVSKITYAQLLASYWSHSQVSDDKIDKWLNQFELIGYPWLGEILISNMYVMSSSELSDIFYKSIEVKMDDIFCVSRDPTIYGKSAEVISNLLRKRFECKKILDDPTSFLEKNNGTLHIFEDGLWTGTEAIGILESILRRRKNTEKHEKIRALSNPSLLYNHSVVLHYSIACDYGFKLLSRFLECEGLTNITVSVPENNYLPILTEFGGQCISECVNIKDLWKNGPPNNVIRPWIFRDRSIWGGLDRMMIAQRVLQHLGAQLFTRYIERQIALLGWKMWPNEKIEKCALGCWNAGLAFGFSHSIPKATLPVFWSGGDVEISGKKLNWVPLFHNAD